FEKADLLVCLRALDHYFPRKNIYSIKSLFKDEQIHILNQVLDTTLSEVDAGFRQLYSSHHSLIRYLSGAQAPLANVFSNIAGFIKNTDLRNAINDHPPNIDEIKKILEETENWAIHWNVGEIT